MWQCVRNSSVTLWNWCSDSCKVQIQIRTLCKRYGMRSKRTGTSQCSCWTTQRAVSDLRSSLNWLEEFPHLQQLIKTLNMFWSICDWWTLKANRFGTSFIFKPCVTTRFYFVPKLLNSVVLRAACYVRNQCLKLYQLQFCYMLLLRLIVEILWIQGELQYFIGVQMDGSEYVEPTRHRLSDKTEKASAMLVRFKEFTPWNIIHRIVCFHNRGHRASTL